MTTHEKAILDALLELEATVQAMRETQPKPSLLPLFSKLDQLTQQLPKDAADPELLHYLHRKSYEKARFWLQGRGAENQKGNCRP